MGIRTIGRPKGYAYPIGLTDITPLTNVSPLTTGGTITADGSGPTANMIHTFTTSGTFTAGFTGNTELLIIGGGGGGSQGGVGAGSLVFVILSYSATPSGISFPSLSTM